jgi:signal transduction histidine kinase
MHTGSVIQGIRNMMRRSSTELTLLDLDETVRDVLELMGGGSRLSRVQLQLDLDSRTQRVLGDRVQLQQVILNLTTNAIEALQAMPEGARGLRISTRVESKLHVETRIEDTGPGLEPDLRERIFEAFFTTKAQGLGLGLSICRSIVAAHGGKIWAELRPEGGSRFCFTTPLAEPCAPAD